jgi:carboxypeptidase Q
VNLEAAIAWAARAMKDDGLENVRTEPVMVPKWVRGEERLELLDPVPRPLVLLGLGGSIGTPPDGIVADAIVVSSFDELDRRAADAKGRIVVFDVPYAGYGQTVGYRSVGASRAARHGAVAMLIRSVGPMGLRTPHTGALNYEEGVPKIPAAAIPVEDAQQLARMQARGQRLRMRLHMQARTEPDAESANLVGEIRGREHPEQIVVVGGHIDSWDVGTGALDDGGGAIATWEAVRLMKKLGLRPRRTVRVVLFTNEENGLRGGLGYRDRHRDQLKNHVLMIESDAGVFSPLGFGFSGSHEARARVAAIASLLEGVGAARIVPGGGGADIGPSMREGSIPGMSLDVEGSRYFIYHHTPADTVERLERDEIARCVAAIAVMAYVVADMPERLPAESTATQ